MADKNANGLKISELHYYEGGLPRAIEDGAEFPVSVDAAGNFRLSVTEIQTLLTNRITIEIAGKAPANASLALESGKGTDMATDAVASGSIASILQTIWAKIRQVANAVSDKLNSPNGSSSQFIKGDGSLDNKKYLPLDTNGDWTIGQNNDNKFRINGNVYIKKSDGTFELAIENDDNSWRGRIGNGANSASAGLVRTDASGNVSRAELPLAIANGGTGKTSAKEAAYNLFQTQQNALKYIHGEDGSNGAGYRGVADFLSDNQIVQAAPSPVCTDTASVTTKAKLIRWKVNKAGQQLTIDATKYMEGELVWVLIDTPLGESIGTIRSQNGSGYGSSNNVVMQCFGKAGLQWYLKGTTHLEYLFSSFII